MPLTASPTGPSAVQSPPQPETGRPPETGRRAGGWVVFACWAAAVAATVVCSGNTAAIVRSGMEQEQQARVNQPDFVPGKGACTDLARNAPPAMFDADSFRWINLVQQQVRAGDLRNRHQPADNLPDGRESHWSAAFAWWLILLAAPVHFLGGTPWPGAIAGVAAPANPILLAVTLAVLACFLRRHAGAWTAGVFTVALATLWGVQWDFGYARPDHHGLQLAAFLGLLLNVLGAGLGWVRTGPETEGGEPSLVRPQTRQDARRNFAWSGFFGGMGLWIGATQEMFGIGLIGLAAGIGTLGCVRPGTGQEGGPSPVRFEPGLWRLWGRVGALTSLGFYLLEYFPAHLTMRLEVNHPLYALAFLGGGELVGTTGEWALTRRRPGAGWWRRVALGLLGLAGLPLAVIAGPPHWYTVRDALSLRLLSVVSEFQPLIPRWTPVTVLGAACQVGALWAGPLLAVALLLSRRRRRLPPWRVMGLGVSVAVAAALCAWLLVQARWLGYASASLAVLALVVCPGRTPASGGGNPPWGLLALTLPGAALFCVQQATINPRLQAERAFGWVPVAAEIGWNLRLAQGNTAEAPRVIAPMNESTALTYYGGARTVGSIYWENVEGCRNQVRFFADDQPGEPEARRIARGCGLDYVVVVTDPTSVVRDQWLARGKVDRTTLSRTLVYRLANPVHPNPPAWLEPLPLRDAPLAQAAGARLYRVRRERL